MKKLILCLFVILLWSLIFAEQTQTATMDSTLVSNLRSAVTNGSPNYDEVIDFYYDITNPGSTRYEEGDGDDWSENRASYEPINKADDYAREAFLGVIDIDLEEPDTTYLNYSKRFLLDPEFPILVPGEYYLDLDEMWLSVQDGNWPVFDVARILLYGGMIVDFLWEYVTPTEQDSLHAILNDIAYFAYLVINEHSEYGMVDIDDNAPNGLGYYPDSINVCTNNIRIDIASALGYAACVLGNAEYISAVEEELFAHDYYGHNGILGLNMSNGGIYSEGLNYAEHIANYLSPFLTARKRVLINGQTKNWYNDSEDVKNLYEKSLELISPEFGRIPFEDTKLRGMDNDGGLWRPAQNSTAMINYYYQTSDQNSKSYIKWFQKGWSNSDYYAGANLQKLYSYENIPYVTESIPPYANGSNVTNSQFTTMRKQIINQTEFRNSPTLIVNHENYIDNNEHEHSDQTSFILYYKGRQLLIDPGYHPTSSNYHIAKDWLASPYAHNVLMVNPDWGNVVYGYNETFELEKDYYDSLLAVTWNGPLYNEYSFREHNFEPIGRTWLAYEHDDQEIPPANFVPYNPSYKEYFIENNNIQHLQVSIKYDHPKVDYGTVFGEDAKEDIIDIKRNFYAFEMNNSNDSFFIIYDKAKTSDFTNSNDFMSQLHFALHPASGNTYPNYNWSDNLTFQANGLFSFETAKSFSNGNNRLYLYGAFGAHNNFQITPKYNLPQGLFCKGNWGDPSYPEPPQWEHDCLRLNTSTSGDEQFLTLLIPSESSTTPIDDISAGSDQYAAKYSLNTGYNCYAAVSDGNDVYCDNGNTRFVTDASFLLVEANNIFTDLKKLIINSDNFLEVRDMSGTDFTNVVVFDSDYNSEEVIAEWSENNELEITTLMSFTSPIPLPIPNPKYKILRCGVLPEDLISKTHYYSSGDTTPQERGTISDNIEILAYDEKYFYVNYSYSDFVSENLLTSELIIHQGVFDGITIQGVTQFGTGDIVLKNIIPVPFDAEIVFLPGSQPQLASNFHLIVDGNLTALGTSEYNIIFDKYSSTNWEKIEITNEGNADMEFCKFLNAQFPLYNRGYIEIENCEFLDNSSGIYLDNPIGYQINHSIINNCSYGILIKDSHVLMYRSAIKNNLITNNNYGLLFYNASAYVEADTIFANKYVGIMAHRGSNPVIVGSSISNTYYNSINYPEIKIGGSSYPIVDRNENDIIFGNGHSIYNMDLEPRDYRCSENWWGTTNELEISNSFFPLSWHIDFYPISQSPNVGYNPWSGGSLFEEGLLAESNDDLITAKTKYTQSIDENPESIEALWSVSRLINCSETETEYAELLQYYDQLQINYAETDLAEAAKLDEIFCNRLLGNHQDAITEYEFLLDENLTFIDSVFTQLDIVYTYMEASSGGNRGASVTFINSENALSSFKQAEEKEVELWSLLENQITDGGIYSPEISKSILHKNYPNPFNPTTTISFSIPEQSKIQIMIYNIKGQKVKTVTNESFDKGNHFVVWNGVDDSGKSVSSGVYFYNLNVNGKSNSIKRCLLLK
ncbi:MAG: heparinase II/III family protein [Candidatus Tenebribacter burtonii]|nr:heparinase II/III family protein [Candidatus Tenebribacter burtonii]